MTNHFSKALHKAITVGLVTGSILAVALVGERIVAAMFDSWKFANTGHWNGIDLGARSSVQFLGLCLFGTAGCLGISRFHHDISSRFSKTVLLAGGLYVCAGIAVVAMVSTGSAYLYCGR